VLVAVALALTACESSQEENAKLAKVYKRQAAAAAKRGALTQRGLSITRSNPSVRVLGATVLHSSEGGAAVVTLRNDSASALRDLPIAITVKSKAGATVYTNTTPGLAATLVSLPFLGAHATITWVQNQVETSSPPASVTAEVGEGERVSEAAPRLEVTGVRLNEGEAEGSLVNHSRTSEHEVVLYAIARRGGAIVAAGGSLVARAEAGTSAHFQAFLVGDAKGAQLEVSVGGAASA
jgi:hypothetical protein